MNIRTSPKTILTATACAFCFLTSSAPAAEPSVGSAADWLARFRFQPPTSDSRQLCPPSRAPLPVFAVRPAATGRQTVRVSLPFAPGSLPAEVGLRLETGGRSFTPDLQVLTYHPGHPRSVRRAIVTFAHEFTSDEPVTFRALWSPEPNPGSSPASRPAGDRLTVGPIEVRCTGDTVDILQAGAVLWRCELLAPPPASRAKPVVELIARGDHYLWTRWLIPDARWPRIIEVRADGLGTVAVRAHVQRLEETDDVVARAPDLGWRIRRVGEGGPARIQLLGETDSSATNPAEHSFATGTPAAVVIGAERIDLPDAHLLRRGTVSLHSDNGHTDIEYRRCRASEQVPLQYAAWRTATVVLGPRANAAWTALLEPPHAVRMESTAFDEVYDRPRVPDLGSWPLLRAVSDYHVESVASCTPLGDDFGNVTAMPRSSVYGMNRLNHCPPIFEEYYRTGDARLRATALHWCENYHDLSIWWKPADAAKFGGTRYNNISAHGERPADPDYMWRSNSAVSFCTKGIDAFFYAYEETGDPRMATALRWQADYAAREVHADTGECRNIGDVADWMRLYRFTGEDRYLEAASRLFRELRTKLSTGDLFSQGGQPIVPDPVFIDEDKTGMKYPFAKPYIIGYALSGLPALAATVPDEPKLRDVIRAVADFQAQAQDPAGGWRYPHPRSSSMLLSQAIEHAVQLARAAAWLETRGEPIDNLLDAIERTLQSRILGWQRSGQILGGLGGWEKAAGALKEGQTLNDLYARPEDRDAGRDYTEGQVSVGGSSPEGVVYFHEVLGFYLAHRPAERLFNANGPLGNVLRRIPAGQTSADPPKTSREYLPYGLADQLPTFRDALLDRLTFPMAWRGGDDPIAFARWREQARAAVLGCLLEPPPRADFASVRTAHEDRGTYDAYRLVFNVSADCRIPAYLLVPKGQGPFPAIVALHDHGAFFPIGKEKMIRPFGGPPETETTAREFVDKCYGGRFVGDALAERGYVVFAADALFWGERGRREGIDYNQQQALAANLMQMGTTWLGVNTWDDMRAAEFVASLPEVDPKRIGAVGLSMGCHRTWMLHAVSDRIAAAVGVCWMCTTDVLMSPGNNQAKGHSAYSMLAPDLRNFLDYPDVASIACPKPLMLFDGGEKDKLFPVAGVDAAYERLREVWTSRNVGDRLVTRRWDYGHVFNIEMQEAAFAWLDKWLKAAKN